MKKVACFLILMVSLFLIEVKSWKFTSNIDTKHQPYFFVRQDGWLGSDGAFSTHLISNFYVWIFSDTLVGKLVNQNGQYVRQIEHMPRNSIAVTWVDPNTKLMSPLDFYWKIGTGNDAIHTGFFSPPAPTHWFWLPSAIQLGQFFYVFGSDMYLTGPDMWDFATDGTFVIGVVNPFTPPDQWQYLESFIPQSNANLILGTAVTEHDGYIYILGLQGKNTVLSRIPTPNFMKLDWSQLMFYGRENNVLSWYPSSPSLQLQPLLTDPPITETTLQFHPYLNQWFMLVIHPFGTEVQITMASNLTGPWSPPQTIFEIPPPWNKSPIFCYAIKSHPELTENANEIVFTFMSNEPHTEHDLEVYVPIVIKTVISP